MRYNNWLASNFEQIPPNGMKAAREHLYAIIDSEVKRLWAASHRTVPRGDSSLPVLFAWAEGLGVYGGNMVCRSLEGCRLQFPDQELPHAFELELDNHMFTLRAPESKWKVRYPYYFMLWDLRDFVGTNDMRLQSVIVSTGTVSNEIRDGYSQATLMIISSPDSGPSEFRRWWFTTSKTKQDAMAEELPGLDYSSYRTYKEKRDIHLEFVLLDMDDNPMVVAYSGLTGPYKSNREHFLDFLSSLRIEDR